MKTDAPQCEVVQCDPERFMPPSSDEDSTVRTTVTIPKIDYQQVEQIAREKRVSVAWVVREAVSDYLSRVNVDGPAPVATKRAARQ